MHFPSIRFLLGTFLGASALLAMEPPDPGMIEAYQKDGTLAQKIAFAKSLGNHRLGNGLAATGRYKLMKAAMDKGLVAPKVLPTPPPRWLDMPTTGTVRTFTLLIDFNDYPHNDTLNSQPLVQGRIFGAGDANVSAPYESYREFYLRSSYNQLDLQGAVLGWYRAGYNRSAMAQTTAGREALIKEAIAYFNGGAGGNHDFSVYDATGDSKVDFFSVVWSGPDNGWANFWWGYQTAFTDEVFTADGLTLGKYCWQWESRYRDAGNVLHYDGPFSPKTLIHEQGHGLGLPDYYDYDDAVGPRGGVGGLDMMDWVGDHNCYSKWLLDWITPEIIDTTAVPAATKTLRDQSVLANKNDALVVMPGAAFPDMTAPFGEFFMIQNRQLTGNDQYRDSYPPGGTAYGIDGSGLLIWHVDSRLDSSNFDYLYDNSFTEHKMLRLMEADGLEEIETAADANAGDFYVAGRTLEPTTTPNTSWYNGIWTNFGIRNISATNPSMTLDIYTIPADTTAPTGKPTKPTGTTDLDQATFTWANGTAADSDGHIIGYYLQVGSTSGGSDIFNANIGNLLTRTITDLGIYEGKPLYARVRAVNTAGLYSEWSEVSAPVTITLPDFTGCSDLDNCDLAFKAVGAWTTDSIYYHAGWTSAQGHTLDNASTTIQTTVPGPGTMTFWWKASTEKDFDYLSCMIDGVVQFRISGDVDWEQRTISIPAGSHVVSWRWAKDSNTTGTLDRVWLDDVQFRNNNDVNSDGDLDVLDLAELAWAFGSDSLDANWVPRADLDASGVIDDADITAFLAAAGF